MGDNRSHVAEPMHRSDVDSGARRVVPCGSDVRDHFAGPESRSAAVVNAHPVRRRREELAPVEGRVGAGDYRPSARLTGRLAGEVAGIEFGERGGEVVEVKCDVGHQLPVGVSLDDAEEYDVEFPRCVLMTVDRGTT